MRTSGSTRRRIGPLLALITVAAFMALPVVPALADQSIISETGPLSTVYTSSDLNCQVGRVDEATGQFYEFASGAGGPGGGYPACATLVATGGTLYGPANMDSGPNALGVKTAFGIDGQSAVTGTGVVGDPYTFSTTVDTGANGLQLVQTDSYVEGDDHYQTDITVTNTGDSPTDGILYRAGDCYLHGHDSGIGAVGSDPTSVACTTTTGSQMLQFTAISPNSHYMEGMYQDVWNAIGSQSDLPDTCVCSNIVDDGAGLSWAFSLDAGASTTVSSSITVGAPAPCDASPPSEPTNVQAFPGNQSAGVSWTAPDSGSPPDYYTVNVTDESGGSDARVRIHPDTVLAPATSAQVTGLVNGDTYHFTVDATNCGGTSPESTQSNSVVPTADSSSVVIGPGTLTQSTGDTKTPNQTDSTIGSQTFPDGTTGLGTLEEFDQNGSPAARVRGADPISAFCSSHVCLGNILQAELQNGTLGPNPKGGLPFYKLQLFLDRSLVRHLGTNVHVYYDGDLSDDGQPIDPTPAELLSPCSGPFNGTPCILRIYRTHSYDLKVIVKSSDLDPRLITSK